MANITPEEAQEALAVIQQTTVKTRRALSSWAYFQIIWGFFWFFGFLASQFVQPNMLIWVWVPLFILGNVACMIYGISQDRRGRTIRSTYSSRIGWFFAALIGYLIIWFVIVQPLGAERVALFLVTVVMFAFVVMSIWSRSLLLAGTCAAVTILALLGYYLLPTYFWGWEAVFCGGTLIGSGVYILLRWR